MHTANHCSLAIFALQSFILLMLFCMLFSLNKTGSQTLGNSKQFT